MEKAKITFLGTGSAVPTEKHNHTSILLTYKSENILFDCGEGTQRQFKYAKISPNKLTRICITHWHGDHILGLPGLFQTLGMSDYQETLKIYGPQGTQRYISLLNEIVTNPIKTEVKEVSSKFIDETDFFIECIPMQHGIPSLAYSFIIKEKRRLDPKKIKKFKLPNSPILKDLSLGKDITFNGKKIKAEEVSYIEPQRKITIILDTAFNETAIEFAKKANILICEATYTKEEQKLAIERKHLTAAEAATIAKKAEVQKLILIHLSQRYESRPKKVLNEAKTIFSKTKIAKDLDIIKI